MRTTVRLDDGLYRELKRVAAERSETFTTILEDAVREMLARRARQAARPRVELPSFRGTGLLPGVDLHDSAALLDLMESRDDPD